MLATITGVLLVNIPYNNHKIQPVVNSKYIDKEIPEVSLVLMVFIACGKKEAVVPNAAVNPSICIQSM